MKTFLIEKDIESLFSALFKSFYDKIIPDKVALKNGYLPILGEEVYSILTDKDLSSRVENALIKYGGFELLNDVKLSLCSSNKNILSIVFNFLYLTFYSKKDISCDLSCSYVCDFNYEVTKVKKEIFRAYSSLKFTKNEDGIIYSAFSPTSDIIEKISPYYVKKLSGLPFIIFDIKRNKSVIYDGKKIIKAVK